ncbi:hypothetical protein D3C85_1073500 [compost metagenome]
MQKTVEFARNLSDFIAAARRQATCEIALTAVDLAQRGAELIQGFEQPSHQQTQQHQTDDHPEQSAEHGTLTEGIDLGHDHALIQDHADVPVHALETGQRDEGHQQILVAAGLLQGLVQRRALAVE